MPPRSLWSGNDTGSLWMFIAVSRTGLRNKSLILYWTTLLVFWNVYILVILNILITNNNTNVLQINELSHSESVRSINEEILPTTASRVSDDIKRLKKLMHIERTKRKYSKFAKISWKWQCQSGDNKRKLNL